MQDDTLQQLLAILGQGQAPQLYSPSEQTLQMPSMPQVMPVVPQRKVDPKINQATAQAVKNGADPALLQKASQYMGKQDYIGLCEAFVERMTKGVEGIYSSAIDAWNKQGKTRKTDLENMQPGDTVYFGADKSNQGYGHAGVYMGNNKMTSATYNGIQNSDLIDWQKQTGQKILGYVPKTTFAQPGI